MRKLLLQSGKTQKRQPVSRADSSGSRAGSNTIESAVAAAPLSFVAQSIAMRKSPALRAATSGDSSSVSTSRPQASRSRSRILFVEKPRLIAESFRILRSLMSAPVPVTQEASASRSRGGEHPMPSDPALPCRAADLALSHHECQAIWKARQRRQEGGVGFRQPSATAIPRRRHPLWAAQRCRRASRAEREGRTADRADQGRRGLSSAAAVAAEEERRIEGRVVPHGGNR